MDIQVTLAVIGAIAFFAGLFGGFIIRDLEIPPLSGKLRVISIILGTILIFIAGWPFIRDEVLSKRTSDTDSSITNTIQSDVENKPSLELTPATTEIPTAQTINIKASDITSAIKGEDGELQKILDWWREDDYGNQNNLLDPTTSNTNEKCFGMAWNTEDYGYHKLIVFQKTVSVKFADGGWYVKVCIPQNIVISPKDIGIIQADWLEKRYGVDNTPWEVIVIE